MNAYPTTSIVHSTREHFNTTKLWLHRFTSLWRFNEICCYCYLSGQCWGDKDQRTPTVKLPTQLEAIKDKINTLDYLFQNSTPEFQGGTLDEWLNGKENIIENIEKSVDIIRHHALVPSDVKVRGIVVDN